MIRPFKSTFKMEVTKNTKDKNGGSPLHLAAEKGHLDALQALLEGGADVEDKNETDRTPLHLAAKEGHLDIIKTLIQANADVNVTDWFDESPLYLAAEERHPDVIQVLIQAGADVYVKDEDGKYPFHLAAGEGHLNVVQAFIHAGADINGRDWSDRSPLHLAAEEGQLDVIQALIQAGADVNVKDKDDVSPLHLAATEGHLDVIRALIHADADINVNDKFNVSPLHLAATEGRFNAVQLLIQCNADVNVKDKLGRSPLHLATEDGHLDVIQALIQAGADVDVKDKFDRSPLHLATDEGHLETTQTLIHANADVNVRDKDDISPIHLAAVKGHLDVIQTLLRADADVNVKDKICGTPLHLAAVVGHLDVTQALIKTFADVNVKDRFHRSLLHLAAEKGYLDVVQNLIQAGADVDITDKYDRSPLHLAAAKGHLRILQVLIQAGAGVDVKDKNGGSPLHMAVSKRHLDVIQALIQAGTGVNGKDKHGGSPLHIAVANRHLDVIQVLIKAGADVNAEQLEIYEPTELHPGAVNEYLEVIHALIQAGANFDVNEGKCRLLLMAINSGHAGVVKLLILLGVDVNLKVQFGISAKDAACSSMKQVISECENIANNIPKEIRVLGSRATVKYLLALEDNAAISNTIRVMLVGHFGVGKTTIAMNLLERKEKRIDSTNGIEVYINQCVYDKREGKWITERKYKDTLFGFEGIIRLDLVDFAGQLIFYTTHQTYLTSRALYILVFNLAMGVHAKVCDENLNPGKSELRVIDFLEFWISTIVTYARGEEAGFPKIVLVGTHRDEVKKKSDLVLIREEIEEKFKNLVMSSQLVVREELFISAKDMSDETRKSIRDVILQEGTKYKEFGEHIPASWIALQEKLVELREKKTCIITMEHVKQINRDLDIPLDEEELDIFLSYLHNMGCILYFNTPTLKGKVILDPKILIDAMTCFITCERFVTNRSIRNVWSHMRKYGEVKKSHILEVWDGKGLTEHAEHLLGTIKKLDLICEPMVYKSGQKISSLDFFVVPSMINAKKPKSSVVKASGDSQAVLVFSSETLLPPAIFNRLVCSCLALWPIFNQHFYNGQVVIKSGRFHLLELVRDVRKITVAISHIENTKCPDFQLCLAIKQFLTETLNQIVAVYSTNEDGPISCDSSSLDVFSKESLIESGRHEDSFNTECKCDEYVKHNLGDVNLMRIAKQLQRIDLCVVCTVLLNDAGFADQIELNFKQFRGDVKIFYVLQEWKRKTRNVSVSELKQLFDDHLEYLDEHIICKAMKDAVSNPDDIPSAILVSKVNPEFLNAVADKITYQYLHLGLELGFTLNEMEHLQIDNQKVIEVTRAMLFGWSENNKKDATVLNLAKAYKRCGEENLAWIGSEFDLEKMIQRENTNPIRQRWIKCCIT